MATLFSRIIAGEIPSHRIAENAEFYAFLDINPVQIGHTLVVPKREVDYYFDLSDEELGRMQAFAKQVAVAIKAHTACLKVGIAVMGLEINHAHLHLIPLKDNGDMNVYLKLQQSAQELAATAEGIRQHLPAELK
ncbi:MAG: HIT family protein [Porphyromonas sp.]|nr:HIT family protein [Porphyromonas sp.]